MRIALDTNILAYAEGVDDDARRALATELIERLPEGDVFVPVQALGELFSVLIRKGRLPAQYARRRILSLRDTFEVVATSPAVIIAAIDLATDHRFSIWDATMLAAAAEAGCRLLLSEDMQDGFAWGGTTIVNPFAPTPSPLLRQFVGKRSEE